MVNAKIISFKRIFETYNFQHFFLYLIFCCKGRKKNKTLLHLSVLCSDFSFQVLLKVTKWHIRTQVVHLGLAI